MIVDARTIKAISSQVYRQFPEVKGSNPTIRLQSSRKKDASPAVYLLTYRGAAKTADGKTISRLVRVVADERGRIIKTSTSR